MPASHQQDFPGLLSGGLHDSTLADIRETCVNSFDRSVTRPGLMEKLETVVKRLEAANVSCDIWVDGSFSTRKINPKDIDVVLRLPSQYYNSPVAEIQACLAWLKSSEVHDQMGIDCYTFPDYPADSPQRPRTTQLMTYWQNQFGTARDNKTPKGIFVIKVGRGVA